MRTKVTIALLLLNAVLFYYIVEVRKHSVPSAEVTTILGSETSNIQALAIINPNNSADDIRLTRRGEDWAITSPLEWPANPFAIRRIITDLQQLRSLTSFTVQDMNKNGQTLADYGLEKPSWILSFTPASPFQGAPTPVPIELKIGNSTQYGNRLYILSPDGQRVHVVERSLAESLSLRLDDIRSDILFKIAGFETRSLNIELPNGSRVRLRRDNERWALETPIQARADKVATQLTVSSLAMLRVYHFVENNTQDAARAALASPLRVTLEGTNRIETLLIGNAVPKTAPADSTQPAPAKSAPPREGAPAPEPATEYYAQLDSKNQEDTPTLFTIMVPDALMSGLRDAQEKLRDRRILDIDPASVIGITIDAPPQMEVSLQSLETGSINPANTPWEIVRLSSGSGPQTIQADRNTVDRLLRALTSLRAEQFVNDAPSDAEKENYGFTSRPAREVILTIAPAAIAATQRSTTGAPQALPPPSRITLQIGSGVDHHTYARVTNQNYIYRVDPAILDALAVTTLAYREHVLSELPAGAQITALKLTDLTTQQHIVDTSLPLAENAPNRTNIEMLATQLRTLKAKTFISDEFTKMIYTAGEERPWRYELEITVTLSGGTAGAAPQTNTTVIFLADRSGGTTQLMGSPRDNVVFEAEQPLVDALFALIYGPRDPGPPEPVPTPEPAAN